MKVDTVVVFGESKLDLSFFIRSFFVIFPVERWEKAGEPRARLYIPAIGALLGVPAFFLVIAVPSFYASMLFLFIE